MAEFLIDENLPYHFKLWENQKFIHVYDLKIGMDDKDIWLYAKNNNLTIVTKDADFSNKIIFDVPPPKVIHLRIGNMKISQLHEFLNRNWKNIVSLSQNCKLTNVYIDRIEGVD